MAFLPIDTRNYQSSRAVQPPLEGCWSNASAKQAHLPRVDLAAHFAGVCRRRSPGTRRHLQVALEVVLLCELLAAHRALQILVHGGPRRRRHGNGSLSLPLLLPLLRRRGPDQLLDHPDVLDGDLHVRVPARAGCVAVTRDILFAGVAVLAGADFRLPSVLTWARQKQCQQRAGRATLSQNKTSCTAGTVPGMRLWCVYRFRPEIEELPARMR